MNTSKHTPGPWSVGPIERADDPVPEGTTRLCSIDGISIYCARGTLCDDPAADARLIAAAPDLLAALERIAAGDPSHGQFAVLAISEARAALAKAGA